MGRRWTILLVALAICITPTSARASGAGELRARVLAERRAHGLAPLSDDARLVAMAERHTERMVAAGAIFHNEHLSGELNGHTRDWTVVGENVGAGPSIEEIHDALMASASHRANILEDEYNAVGIATIRVEDGRLYVTQVFARLDDRPTAPVLLSAWPTTCLGGILQAEDGTWVPASFYGC